MEARPRTLPNEIVRNLLLRLSLKTLSLFKSVCRSWHSLICDPRFGQDHLKLNLSIDNILKYGCIEPSLDPSRNSPSFFVYDVKSKGDASEIEYPFEGSFLNAQILGSCNGLLLIGNCGPSLYIWNPTTREHKRISAPFFNGKAYVLWALSFDSSRNDYKVVQIVTLLSRTTCTTTAKSFSFKRNSWRNIKFDQDAFNNRVGILVNDSPHWLVDNIVHKEYNRNLRLVISCFDTKREEFNEVPCPSSRVVGTHVELGTLGGCLCIATTRIINERGGCVVISAMKEYGVKESWVTLFMIPCTRMELRVLGCMKNDNIFIQIDRKNFGFYDKEKSKFVKVLMCDSSCGFKGALFVESIVSPKFVGINGGDDDDENVSRLK